MRRCRIRWAQRRVSFWSPAIQGRAEGLSGCFSCSFGEVLTVRFLDWPDQKRSIESANLELQTSNFSVGPTKRQRRCLMRRNSSSELCEGRGGVRCLPPPFSGRFCAHGAFGQAGGIPDGLIQIVSLWRCEAAKLSPASQQLNCSSLCSVLLARPDECAGCCWHRPPR